MKLIIRSWLILIIVSIAGCNKEESLTHITDFEMKVHKSMNAYRSTKMLPGINLLLLMVDDAQNYSKKIAAGQVPYGVDDVLTSLNTLKINLGGDASGAVVQFSEKDNADTVINRIIRDPVKREVIEQDLNQVGVGSAKDKNGNWYVTLLFLHIP